MTWHKIGGIRFLYCLGIVRAVWLPSMVLAQTYNPSYARAFDERVKESIQKYREALRLKPDAQSRQLYLVNLGQAYRKSGRHQEAI